MGGEGRGGWLAGVGGGQWEGRMAGGGPGSRWVRPSAPQGWGGARSASGGPGREGGAGGGAQREAGSSGRRAAVAAAAGGCWHRLRGRLPAVEVARPPQGAIAKLGLRPASPRCCGEHSSSAHLSPRRPAPAPSDPALPAPPTRPYLRPPSGGGVSPALQAAWSIGGGSCQAAAAPRAPYGSGRSMEPSERFSAAGERRRCRPAGEDGAGAGAEERGGGGGGPRELGCGAPLPYWTAVFEYEAAGEDGRLTLRLGDVVEVLSRTRRCPATRVGGPGS